MEGKSTIKIKLSTLIFLILIIVTLFGILIYTISINPNLNWKKSEQAKNKNEVDSIISNTTITNSITKNEVKKANLEVTGPELSEFDLKFLKLENKEENKIYSPLSIKYALKMLESAANGESKEQISRIIGKYDLTKYKTNENMSLANAFFIRDSFSSQVKESYITTLKNKFNVDVKFDSFENADNINSWIDEKTFQVIPTITDDETVNQLDFALINALAIDMDWEEKFIMGRGENCYPSTEFLHEKRKFNADTDWQEMEKRGINVFDIDNVSSANFEGIDTKLNVSGMGIYATINNYDIINELGEENIRKIVSDEYRKFAKGEEYDTEHAYGDFPLSEDISDSGIEKDLNTFFETYIPELKENYHKYGTSTEFSIYTDKDVKVFAKDLKEYNDTTLQYIGIMPTTEKLESFVEKMDSKTISNYISNLKEINYKNFKEGVVTRIFGYIPKFEFEYSLDLMNDLKKIDVTHVFDEETADLSNMTENRAFITEALHKANIEFTQDGIKAAAATFIGGAGAGTPFDYLFDVPVEEIDMTFDKPYMFLIRDKKTNETWFVGTVYEPLLWELEPEKEHMY